MRVKDSGLSRSRRLPRDARGSTRWGRRGKCYGSELVGSTGLPLNISVSAPLRVMASSTLCIKDASFPKRGSRMLGTRYGTHLLSLFRLYVVKKGSLGILSPIIWLDMTLGGSSFVNPGPGGGFSMDLYASGKEFLETVWICNLLFVHGIFSYDKGIPSPTI